MSVSSSVPKGSITAKDTKSDFGARGWLLILYGLITLFIVGSVQNDSLNVVIPQLVERHGWSAGAISRITSYATIFGAFMCFTLDPLTRKFGVKRMLMTTLAIVGIGVTLYGRVTSIGVYAVTVFCVVASCIATANYLLAVLVTNWFPTRKGLVLGYATVGNNLGSIFIAWLLTFAWNQLGFSNGFVAYGALVLIPICLLAFGLKDYPEYMGCFPDNDKNMTREEAQRLLDEGKRYEATSSWTPKKLLTTSQTWKVGLSLGLMCLCISGILTHIVPIFMSRGYTTTQSMTAMSISGIVAIPMSILLGKLDAKMGAKAACMTLALSGAACFFLTLIPVKWSVIFGVLAAAALMGCLNNMAASLPASIFGRYDLKRAQSCVLPIMFCMQAVGVGLTGTLGELYGGFTLTLCIMGISCLASALVLASLPDKCIGRTDAPEE